MQGNLEMCSDKKNEIINIKNLVNNVNNIIEKSKSNIYKSINSEMVKAYFEIGRELVEEEQKGQNRAEYGKAIIKNLSIALTKAHGKGYSIRNIETMKQFYETYKNNEIVSPVVTQLLHIQSGSVFWNINHSNNAPC